MCNMAAGFHALGNDRAAEEMHREALAGKIRAMGEEHPEALLSIGHLAICVEYQVRRGRTGPGGGCGCASHCSSCEVYNLMAMALCILVRVRMP